MCIDNECKIITICVDLEKLMCQWKEIITICVWFKIK